jgi:hypothetical protein
MIVREDERSCAELKRASDDLAGIKNDLIDSARRGHLVEQQPVRSIEVQHVKALARIVCHSEQQIVSHDA